MFVSNIGGSHTAGLYSEGKFLSEVILKIRVQNVKIFSPEDIQVSFTKLDVSSFLNVLS